MELRPNDLPVMEIGETRNVTVNVAGAAGVNSISGTPTATCDSATIGTVSASGLNITFPVTATSTGTYPIIVTAVLSSGERVKGMIRLKVKDSAQEEYSRDDYGC